MNGRIVRTVVLAGLLSAVALVARADTAAEVYGAMGIKPGDVLTGTVLSARVVPAQDKQVVCVTTYFTGKREKSDAVNVRLDVFNRRESRLVSIHTRDFGAENGGNVGDGNLELVDLDSDGLSEIIVSYDSYGDPLIEQRFGEVIFHDGQGLRTVWSGPVEYDATRAARKVPAERRDRFRREIDFANTLRARGATLFFNKKMIAVAGERLAQPKIVQESFPLRASVD